MATRRDELKTLGFGGLELAAARFAGAEGAGPPYARTVTIDGAGGTGLLWFENDDAATRSELDAIRASGLGGIVLTLAPSGRLWLDDAAFEKTKTTIDTWDRIIARHPDHLLAVRSGGDLQRAWREGKLGLIYGFQGTESLGEDLDRIAQFRARGARDPAHPQSPQSRRRRLQRAGLCRSQQSKVASLGIIFWPYLRTDTQPMAIDVIRHIGHAVNVCGEDHVGIGIGIGIGAVEDGVFERGRPPDLYTFIPDLNRADRFDMLAAMLSKRGHPDARIEKILGGNFARVMDTLWR
jgi:microsomal dipeptidase-like Zn-dependent dipeptidase